MPIGPNGEVRPASSISAMAVVMKIATGEIEEQYISEEHKKAHKRRSFTVTVESCHEDND